MVLWRQGSLTKCTATTIAVAAAAAAATTTKLTYYDHFLTFVKYPQCSLIITDMKVGIRIRQSLQSAAGKLSCTKR